MKDTYRRSDQRSKFIGESSVAPDLNELGKLLTNLSTEDRLLSRSMLCFKLRYSISPCPSLQTRDVTHIFSNFPRVGDDKTFFVYDSRDGHRRVLGSFGEFSSDLRESFALSFNFLVKVADMESALVITLEMRGQTYAKSSLVFQT